MILTLWEIMKPIIATNISTVFSEMTQLIQISSTSPNGGEIPFEVRNTIAGINLFKAQYLCTEFDLPQSMLNALRLSNSLKNDAIITSQELLWKLDCLRELMESEMKGHLYFRVEKHLRGYVDNQALFGDEVNKAFPSIENDLKQAGNCLAFGCNTAAVFHLMRVAEVGLWELGRDRQIPVAGAGKIEFTEWGVIIKELEHAVKAIQQWENCSEKEEAHKFYNHSLEELRAFNDGWRRHASHARPFMIPTTDAEGLALWGHVERFMRTLATEISEGGYTKMIW